MTALPTGGARSLCPLIVGMERSAASFRVQRKRAIDKEIRPRSKQQDYRRHTPPVLDFEIHDDSGFLRLLAGTEGFRAASDAG